MGKTSKIKEQNIIRYSYWKNNNNNIIIDTKAPPLYIIHTFLRSHSEGVARPIYRFHVRNSFVNWFETLYPLNWDLVYRISNIHLTLIPFDGYIVVCLCIPVFPISIKWLWGFFRLSPPLFHSLWRLYRSTNDVPFINIRFIDKCFVRQPIQRSSRF